MSYRDSRDYSDRQNSRADQIFVGRLPRNTKVEDVQERFGRYGTITRCDVKAGTNTDYAFIKYEDRKDAEDAMESENGAEFNGANIVIEWSTDSKGGRSRRGGGGGGRGWGRGGGGGGYGGRNGGGRYRDDRDSYRGGGGGYRDDYRRDDYRHDDDSRGRSRHDDYHDNSSRQRSRSGERYY